MKQKLRKKTLFIILISLIVTIILVLGIVKLVNHIRVKNAKIEVKLVTDLNVEYGDVVYVSDYILSINGKIVDDYKIDTSKLGPKEVEFEFVNEENIKVKYTYNLNVEDTTPPLIWLSGSYTVKIGSEDDLVDKILCGDNYDNKPNCYIEGDYDLNTADSYALTFKAEDKNGNKSQKDFILNVYEPVEKTENDDKNQLEKEEEYTSFTDIVNEYSNENVKIGIDISKWQGEIDFQALKKAGVEFVIIRVGGTRGKDGEYFLDEYFERNIKQANKVGIPAGVYFYSYASSSQEAQKQAKWVVKQIKKYDIDMPIVFDWEEWNNYNEYNLSFFGLTSMAESFLKVIEDKGYQPMLYSSKTYLENMWMQIDYPIWLAQYNNQVTYNGDYKMWQLCDDGKVDGIEGPVDIDIYYK